MLKTITRWVTAASLLLVSAACNSTSQSSDLDELKQRVAFLASDELEGRGVGTDGLATAADYLVDELQRIGLEPAWGDRYTQQFEIDLAREVGEATSLTSNVDDAIRSDAYVPLGVSNEGEFEGDVAFVGYAIDRNDTDGYDDFAGVELDGKVALALRYEPHDADGKSRFGGDNWSQDAAIWQKAQRAGENGAAALLLVTPPMHHDDQSGLMSLNRSRGRRATIPVFQITHEAADALLAAAEAPRLDELQATIDQSVEPVSFALDAVRVSGVAEFESNRATTVNVAGVLRGSEAADEFIVVGAHYDHLGRGEYGSLSGSNQIHNGADDNASGTAALIELAERMARGPTPRRSIVFAFFSGEELGLLGSREFVNDPPVSRDSIVAMLNLDMIGRVRDETVWVGGVGTAAAFEEILADADEASALQLKTMAKGGLGPSDHASFAGEQIPVLFLFSGTHADYHRPTDDADKLNYDDMIEVVALAERIVGGLDAMRPQQYVADFDRATLGGTPGGVKVRIGVMPAYDPTQKGMIVQQVMTASPASAAGIENGDRIVAVNDEPIDDIYGYMDVMADVEPGDDVSVRVVRGDEQIDLTVTPTRSGQVGSSPATQPAGERDG